MSDRYEFSRQRYSLLAGSLLSTALVSHMIWTYVKNKALRRRPGSLLMWRAIFELLFCVVIIIIEIYFAINGFPKDCLSAADGPPINYTAWAECIPGCQTTSGILQFFNLGAESYFFVISVDLLLNLETSPFGSSSIRNWYYQIFVVATSLVTALLLTRGDAADGDWGPGKIIRHVCWNKSFGEKGFSSGGGLYYYYIWEFIYYPWAILVYLYSVCKMRGGLKKTLEVRRRRIDEGKTITIFFFCYLLMLFLLYKVLLDSLEWIGLESIFAFILGARGLADWLVWQFIVVNKPGSCCDSASGASAARVMKSSKTGLHEGIYDGDLEAAGEGEKATGGSAEQAAAPRSAAEEEALELNEALRDEVLFFTMLGVRTAAQRAKAQQDAGTAYEENVDLMDEAPDSVTGFSDEGVAEMLGRHVGSSQNLVCMAPCGVQFMECREVFGVSPEQYQESMSEHCNARFDGGASGAVMFFSQNKRFVVKQMESEERDLLRAMLPAYLAHVKANPDTLLLRIVQMVSIRMYRTWLHFIVCENVFFDVGNNAALAPSEVYDLKGSWIARNATKIAPGKMARCRICNEKYEVGSKSRCSDTANGVHLPSSTFKDQDLLDKIYLRGELLAKIKQVLTEDTRFLAEQKIMDYSLLLGIDNSTFYIEPEPEGKGGTPQPFFRTDGGGLTSYVVRGPGKYYFGLIDILQQWNWKKKIERFIKTQLLGKDKAGISAINPEAYRKRFLEHMDQITSDGTEHKSTNGRTSSTHRKSVGRISPASSSASPAPRTSFNE